MRHIVGFRFIFAIALPILLATISVLSLTSNLLTRVSDSADLVENKRSHDIVIQVLQGSLASLGQLTRENAHWDDAYEGVYPVIDNKWIDSTWGSINSIGRSHDVAVVLEHGKATPVFVAGMNGPELQDLPAYLGPTYRRLFDTLPKEGASPALATSFAATARGAAMVALSPIVPQDAARTAPGFIPRYLMLIRYVSRDMLSQIESSYLIQNLSVAPVNGANANGLMVSDIAGNAAFAMTWAKSEVGATTTDMPRQQASLVLGFLVLVMCGIAVVCWRLIQNVVKNEELALHQAMHDQLTSLPNRASLVDRLKSLRQSKVGEYAVAYADLDGFKEVNDSFGHHIGDRLLLAVGDGIARLASSSNIASRMGGDEFVVLFVGEKSQENATLFSRHLLRFLAKPFDLDGRIAFVGASIGIAVNDAGDHDELEILRRADIAMYRAKSDGKNRSCVYDPSFDVERAEAQGIATELAGLIEQRNIDIAFQPVVSTRDMKVSGVEVLARWPQTSKRKVTPDQFVTVAESAGLIDDLGEIILDKACAAAKSWPDLRLAINISAVQLNNPQFVERAMAIIEKHNISTRRIEFEITETSLIREADRAKFVFKELQRYGIKIALDDFGTGFSSIGYLRTFKFDRIKIDKSIISKVLTNPGELAIVQGTLLVARGLSAEVTAEGVERDEEAAILKLAGCTELQGFKFYKPMAASAITALVENAKPKRVRQAAG